MGIWVPTQTKLQINESQHVRVETWVTASGEPHREEGNKKPSQTRANKIGIIEENYHSFGKLHRDECEGPAQIQYTFNKQGHRWKTHESYFKNGKQYREFGPAVIDYSGNQVVKEIYYQSETGLIHRNEGEGPAVVHYDFCGKKTFEEYWVNGKFHREDGPAVIFYNNLEQVIEECWFCNGVLHREGGPATLSYWKGVPTKRSWYWNGELHRVGGPAVENLEYWEHGVQVG